MKRLLRAWPLWSGILLLAAYYWNVLTGEKALLYRDMAMVYLPTRAAFASRLLAGEIPEWYPFDGLGSSYVANVVTAMLHPSVLLHLLLPDPYALSLSAILAHFAAGAGAYLLLHHWRCAPLPAFIGAVAYAFSGYLIGMDGNLPYLLAASAVPWCILGFDGCVQCLQRRDIAPDAVVPDSGNVPTSLRNALLFGPAIPWILATIIAMAFLTTSGDPQAVLITAATLLAIALASPRRCWPKNLTCLGIAGVLTFLVTSPQLIPAIAATGARDQDAETLRAAMFWSLNPLEIMDFLVPGPTFLPDGRVPEDLLTIHVFGGYWSESLFLGTAVLSLAGLAIARPAAEWRRPMRITAFVGLLAFVLSLGAGHWNPAYALFQRLVPGWRLLRYPQKSLVFATLALALLAGLGADRLLAARSGKAFDHRENWRAFMHRAAFWSVTCLAAYLLLPLDPVQRCLLVLGGGLGDEASNELSAIVPVYQTHLFTGFAFGLAAMAFAIPARSHRSGSPSSIAKAAALLAVAIPLALATLGMNQGRFRNSPEQILRQHPLAENLESLAAAHSFPGSYPRLFAQNDLNQASEFLASLGMPIGMDGVRRLQVLNLAYGMSGLFHMEQAVGYIPMTGQSRQRFVAESIPNTVFWNGFSIDAAIVPNPSPSGVEDAFIALPNPSAGARIRLAKGVPVHDMDEAAAVTKGAGFDAATTIPVELPEGDSWDAFAESFHGQSAVGTVKVDGYRPERIAVSTDSPTPSTLFVADGFAPGWTATVDGHPADILPGLVAGRALLLPPGKHRVEMNYRTPGLRAGFILAGIGWAILLAAFILWRRGVRMAPPPASKATADATDAAT